MDYKYIDDKIKEIEDLRTSQKVVSENRGVFWNNEPLPKYDGRVGTFYSDLNDPEYAELKITIYRKAKELSGIREDYKKPQRQDYVSNTHG